MHHPLRRTDGGVGIESADRARRTGRPHRPERRGQDDRVQSHHRRLSADRTAISFQRPVHRRPQAASTRRARHRADVSKHPAVRLADASSTMCAPPLICIVRTASATRSGAGAPFATAKRTSPTQVMELLEIFQLGKFRDDAGQEPELRRPAAAGNRPRPGHAAETAAARRTRRRNEPHRKSGIDAAHPVRQGQVSNSVLLVEHDMQVVMGICRAHRRSGLRRENRRRHAGGNPREPESHRGLSRRAKHS